MLPSIFPKGSVGASTAILALADGTVFRGDSIGATGSVVAEIVFNTAMSGYQEIITDPACRGQIVAFTYPHIGNTGINPEDGESGRVQAAGLVVRDCPALMSNFRATQSLPEYLRAQGVVAIAGIDTRKLARILRERGAQGACIMVGGDAGEAVELARSHAGIAGQDLAHNAGTDKTTSWQQGGWSLGQGYSKTNPDQARFHVLVYDFGVRHSILRALADRSCRITLVPATTPADQALAHAPDGILLSSGPGDPAACDQALSACRSLIDSGIPMFGIGLGHQIMALALGGGTSKMKTGHHGSNHPVRDESTGRAYITGQNHGFMVNDAGLPANAHISHRSLFDGSIQGLRLAGRPVISFQGRPEGSPGPNDIQMLFDQFAGLMSQYQSSAAQK